MSIKNTLNLFVAVIFTFILTACGGNTKDNENTSSENEHMSEMSDNDATASGIGEDGLLAAKSLESDSLMGMDFAKAIEKGLLKDVVYFEFDQDQLSPESRDNLDDVAKLLKAIDGSLILMGHADERGTREYNLALSERRGKSVKNYLMVQGVKASRLEVIGYGEEKPASTTDDAANRRVVLTK